MFFSGLARSITFTVTGEGVAVFCSRAVVLHRRDSSLVKETSVEAEVASFRRHLAVFVTNNSRTIQVRADRAQWEKLRENDRVKLTYRAGKYTGTAWYAEIQ
jgi:hypothetical protein